MKMMMNKRIWTMKNILTTLIVVIMTVQPGFTQKLEYATNTAIDSMAAFRKTSPLRLDEKRLAFLHQFQRYSDRLEASTFKAYLAKTEDEAEQRSEEHTSELQ